MELPLLVSLVVLAFLGLINASYIAYKRKKEQPLVCLIDGNCNAVIKSRWSRIFFIRNDTLGMIYFAIVLFLGTTLFFSISYATLISKALLIINGLAFLFSLFLLYVQKYKIRNYCFYCLISALITFLVFINTLVL